MSVATAVEDAEMLREVARRFLDAHGVEPDALARRDSNGLWEAAVELGWTQLTLPVARGGGGGTYREACVLAEEIGRALAPLPLVSATLAGAAVCQQDGPGLARLDDAARPAIVLEGSGAVYGKPPATARQLPSGSWVVDGDGLLAADGTEADLLVVLVSCGARVALALVDPTTTGVHRRRLAGTDPSRALTSISLESVALEDAHVLGPQDDAGLMTPLVDRAAVLIAAESLGIARAVLETATAHAASRMQFGRPIGSYQAVQHTLASVVVEIEHAESLVHHAAAALDDVRPDTSLAASMAKLYLTRTARNAAAAALQVHGGLGFTWESRLHLYFKRAKANQALFGTSDWHADRIASLSGWGA